MFTPPTTRGRDVGTSVRSAWFTMVAPVLLALAPAAAALALGRVPAT
jgi:hypothetical protein